MFLANPNNPTGTYVPFDEVKRLHRGLPPHVLLVLDAAYAEYVRRNDYEAGIELVATTENVVMCRTFSKIYGLAALRLGWMYGPAHVVDALNRIRGPFNVNAAAIAAGIAALEDTAHVEAARAHNERWLAWLHGGDPQARPRGDAERRQFRADPLSRPAKGRTAEDADAFLTKRGLILRRVTAYTLPNCAAHDRRQRGGEPAGRRGARGIHGPQMSGQPVFNRLALIGIGLIGSSIARAARAQGAARSIVATARSRRHAPAGRRARHRRSGGRDQRRRGRRRRPRHRLHSGRRLRRGRAEIGPHLEPGAIVSDVGSVKGSVLRDMAPHIPAGVHFVPAHPVAGTEYSGPDAGFAELFVNRWCILTPPPDADPAAVERLAAFWRALGANVETMSAEHHDLVLAITSHLPHLIAYTIVGTADELGQVTRSEVMKFSAGGFRDFTRIAASDPTMWRDVFLANKDAVLEMLGRFNEDICRR